VGRAVFGSVKLIEDLVRSDESILLLGRPGVGKTTILREVARVLADDLGKRVVIVDTSNEIAGDGDVPHPAIGRARRLQVPRTELQHKVMIEAVENHMPEVIIIDEMSTELEALAARTIAERGVQLVATAHGNTLENLVSNPSLSDLVGGTQTVTLGDLEARRRGTQKTVLERKHEPTFEIVIEIRERNNVAVHREVGTAVDLALRGYPPGIEVRWMEQDGSIHSMLEEPDTEAPEIRPPPFEIADTRRPRTGRSARYSPRLPERRPAPRTAPPSNGPAARAPEAPPEPTSPPVKVYPFGIPRATLQEAIALAVANAAVTEEAAGADFFLTTKSHYNRRPTEVRESEKRGVPVYVLRRGTSEQVLEFLRRFGPKSPVEPPSRRQPRADDRDGATDQQEGDGEAEAKPADVRNAMAETEDAIQRVLSGERKVTLAPQSSFIRRLQHGLASKYNLGSASMGRDPGRRVVIRRRR
jgi:nucleoside-triphosphatase THEP1